MKIEEGANHTHQYVCGMNPLCTGSNTLRQPRDRRAAYSCQARMRTHGGALVVRVAHAAVKNAVHVEQTSLLV